MNMLKSSVLGLFFVSVMIFLLFSSPLRAGVILPDSGGFDVGDFTIYSLAEINFREIGDPTPGPGDPFFVASSPGALTGVDAIVIATGTNNMGLNDNPAGMDDAYETPSGSPTDSLTFNTITVSDPGGSGEFTGDSADTWDIEVDVLRDYLNDGGGEFVVYFNMNETGFDGLAGIDLLIWASFTLSGGTGPDETFFLRDQSDPTGNPDDWVQAFGTICATMTAFLHTGPCTPDEESMLGAETISQNLGANNAAFAAFSQELNDLILNSDFETLSISARMTELNDGFEQVFILSDTTTTPRDVSEPGMLGIIFGGMLFILWRRRDSGVRLAQQDC